MSAASTLPTLSVSPRTKRLLPACFAGPLPARVVLPPEQCRYYVQLETPQAYELARELVADYRYRKRKSAPPSSLTMLVQQPVTTFDTWRVQLSADAGFGEMVDLGCLESDDEDAVQRMAESWCAAVGRDPLRVEPDYLCRIAGTSPSGSGRLEIVIERADLPSPHR